jgi:hypothetical protein
LFILLFQAIPASQTPARLAAGVPEDWLSPCTIGALLNKTCCKPFLIAQPSGVSRESTCVLRKTAQNETPAFIGELRILIFLLRNLIASKHFEPSSVDGFSQRGRHWAAKPCCGQALACALLTLLCIETMLLNMNMLKACPL